MWKDMRADQKPGVAARMGELMARLHEAPVQGLETLAVDWEAFLAERREKCVADHEQAGAREPWLTEIRDFVDLAPPLFEPLGD